MTAQLSPAAQAVMIAATNGNFNVVNDPVYKQCIAAALRAAVDQVQVRQYAECFICDSARLLAIAAELEGICFTSPAPPEAQP